jgi:hypothetical protein
MDWKELQAYSDGELGRDEKRTVEDLLRRDPAARHEVESVYNLKTLLREKALRHDSPEAWKACVGRLDEIDKSRRTEHFVGKYAWGICGAFLVALVLGRMTMSQVPATNGGGEVAFARSILGANFEAPRDAKQVQFDAWMKDLMGEVRANLEAPPMRVVVFPAVERPQGREFPSLLIPADGKPIRFLASEIPYDFSRMRESDGFHACRIQNQNVVAWKDGARSFVMLADRDPDEMLTIARLLRKR